MQQGNKTELSCLYTKHKTQKRKVWNDGRLVVLQSTACLHDANPVPGSSDPVLDQCDLSKDQRQVLLEERDMILEGEKFLIDVQGAWSPQSLCASKTKPARPQMSSSLKKKFRIPPPYMPSTSNSQQGTMNLILGKRKRPLQPGELAQMYRKEAAPHHCRLTPQQTTSTRNHYGCENHDRNNEANIHSMRSPLDNHGFPCSSLQEDVRTQRNLQPNHVRNSLNGKNLSKPRLIQPMVVSADSSGQPEHEVKSTASNQSLAVVNRNTLEINEFDAEAFYGLEEEENDEEYVSTERKGSVSRNYDEKDSTVSVSCLPDSQSLSTGPIALKVPNQDDDAFLAMFGAAPVHQRTREAGEESHEPKCDRTKFVLPSQSSSEDES